MALLDHGDKLMKLAVIYPHNLSILYILHQRYFSFFIVLLFYCSLFFYDIHEAPGIFQMFEEDSPYPEELRTGRKSR